jgi:hypothetical protein
LRSCSSTYFYRPCKVARAYHVERAKNASGKSKTVWVLGPDEEVSTNKINLPTICISSGQKLQGYRQGIE